VSFSPSTEYRLCIGGLVAEGILTVLTVVSGRRISGRTYRDVSAAQERIFIAFPTILFRTAAVGNWSRIPGQREPRRTTVR
jgi:hypothetical protein